MGLQWIGRLGRVLHNIPVIGSISDSVMGAAGLVSRDIQRGYDGTAAGPGGTPPAGGLPAGVGWGGSAGLGALGTILSGIWQQKRQDKANDENWKRYLDSLRLQKKNQGVNFVKLRRDAIKGGFNPLTALGATGGAGYSMNVGQAPLTIPEDGAAVGVGNAAGLISANVHDVELANLQHKQALDEMDHSLAMQARLGAGVPAFQAGYSVGSPTAAVGAGLNPDLSDPNVAAAASLSPRAGYVRVWSDMTQSPQYIPKSTAAKYGVQDLGVWDLSDEGSRRGSTVTEAEAFGLQGLTGIGQWFDDTFSGGGGFDRTSHGWRAPQASRKGAPSVDPGVRRVGPAWNDVGIKFWDDPLQNLAM